MSGDDKNAQERFLDEACIRAHLVRLAQCSDPLDRELYRVMEALADFHTAAVSQAPTCSHCGRPGTTLMVDACGEDPCPLRHQSNDALTATSLAGSLRGVEPSQSAIGAPPSHELPPADVPQTQDTPEKQWIELVREMVDCHQFETPGPHSPPWPDGAVRMPWDRWLRLDRFVRDLCREQVRILDLHVALMKDADKRYDEAFGAARSSKAPLMADEDVMIGQLQRIRHLEGLLQGIQSLLTRTLRHGVLRAEIGTMVRDVDATLNASAAPSAIAPHLTCSAPPCSNTDGCIVTGCRASKNLYVKSNNDNSTLHWVAEVVKVLKSREEALRSGGYWGSADHLSNLINSAPTDGSTAP